MRQTIFSLRFRQFFFCLVLIGMVLFNTGVEPALADIRNAKLTVDLPGGATAGAKFNGGATFGLKATWEGDTPPYAATFKAGGDIGTSNSDAGSADFSVSAAALGPGAKSFSVSIIETSVPNAKPGTATGDKQADIDTTPLDLSVQIDSATKKVGKGGTVRFTVTALNGKTFGVVPTAVVNPGGAAATPVNPIIPGSVVNYTYTVPNDAAGGNYTVQVTGKDNTFPQTTANTGSGQDVFGVDVEGPGSPAIVSASVGNPTRAENITLSGTCSAETVSVEVLDKGSSLSPALVVSPSGTNWQATVVSVSEGKHRFTAKSKDEFGNESVISSEMAINVDRTKPNKPVLDTPVKRTSNKFITISGKAATDNPTSTDSLVSTPVEVHLYRVGETATAAASMNADASGNFSFSNIELKADNAGQNIFYAVAEDNARGSPGNMSDQSSTVTVYYDTDKAVPSALLVSSVALASASLPFGDFLAPGTYNVQVTFSENMDRTVNPTISFLGAGGGTQSSSSGSWTASTTFLGQIIIPAGQGTTFDGRAQNIRVSGAKDEAGNTMDDYTQNNPFGIDTTAPQTTMDSMDTIYVGSGTTSVTVQGSASDTTSGVGYVELWWEPFNNPTGTHATQSIGLAPGSNRWVTVLDVAALGIGDGAYKLWAYAGDRARPNPNVETRQPTGYRLLIVDRNVPQVERISFDDESVDLQPAGNPPPTVGSDVTKLTAFINKGSGSSTLVLTVPPMIFTLKDPAGTAITGNYAPMGSSAVSFTFPKLTMNGTYSIEVQPIDAAGNKGTTATRSFILDLAAPDNVRFDPASGTIVNDTYPPIQADEVWAYIDDPSADYTKSTIEVMYNGVVVGSQKTASTSLIWDLYGAVASHPTDQSGDG
ncbi:MAG TPA: Cna B-type domain-containing protein, partial [Candidatus Ozemobacteraceae bacterium]|nr:Cna B-type domain-containing protein [Candidatus Ozemobacteraceae bacterium]